MRNLYYWIDDRTGLFRALRAFGAAQVPGRACPCRSLLFLLVFAFLVQGITGFFMLLYYSPGAQSAWESVYFLQYEVSGGWLLRAVHHWCGQAILVLLGLYLAGMILRGSYRSPREFVFWSVLAMFLLTLGLLLTGDLLAWDENSQSSTLVRVGFLNQLPVVGGGLFKLAAGGPEFGHLTLSRFLGLHAVAMAGGFAVLLGLCLWFARRAAVLEANKARFHTPYWPRQFGINAAVCLVFLLVVGALAFQNGFTGLDRGVELGAPADPAARYEAARPEWAFMGLYGFAHLFPGELQILPVFVIPGSVVLLFFLMPFIGRLRYVGQGFNVLVLLALLAADAGLSWQVAAEDRDNANHQAALATGRQNALRAKELVALQGGIPVEGALSLLQADAKTQGPKLFKQHCASCHEHAGGTEADITCASPSAPNLFGYASRAWVAGWLDPERIAGPHYFGNTKFRNGDMVQHVKETYSDLQAEDKEERDSILMALSAEAKLPAQAPQDAQDAKRIAEGRELLGDCVGCHKYRDQGSLGTAPDQTGYGSREWTIGILANPADTRFYGPRNDRMPAYAPSEDPTKNTLSRRQLELLADWLRGDWVEPEAEVEEKP